MYFQLKGWKIGWRPCKSGYNQNSKCSAGNFADRLSAHGTDEFFPHVAKHARRTVNPPKDSWVAFAPAKRGYKALPHFQIGLWGTHLFIILAVIYENPDKKGIAERLRNNLTVLTALPETYIVSGDHMKPEAVTIGQGGGYWY